MIKEIKVIKKLGKNLIIDKIFKTENELDDNTNLSDDTIAIVQETLKLYILKSNIWSSLGNLITVKGPQGNQGVKGDKGEKGDIGDKGEPFKFDLIVDSIDFLPNICDENKFAIIRHSLELFFYQNRKWEYIGVLKGDKGDIGEMGLKGDKGDKGEKFTFDYII